MKIRSRGASIATLATIVFVLGGLVSALDVASASAQANSAGAPAGDAATGSRGLLLHLHGEVLEGGQGVVEGGHLDHLEVAAGVRLRLLVLVRRD